MGVAMHPGEARWSYSGFHSFRKALALEEGLDLDKMEGFGAFSAESGTIPWDGGDYGDGWITPLAPLLSHSDCDGYINSWDCREVLPRLTEILDKWEAEGVSWPRDYDLQMGRELVKGMQHCAEHGCAMVFS